MWMTKIPEGLLSYQGIIVKICFFFPIFLKEDEIERSLCTLQPVFRNKNTHLPKILFGSV